MMSLCFQELLSENLYLLLQTLLSLPASWQLIRVKLCTLQLLLQVSDGGLRVRYKIDLVHAFELNMLLVTPTLVYICACDVWQTFWSIQSKYWQQVVLTHHTCSRHDFSQLCLYHTQAWLDSCKWLIPNWKKHSTALIGQLPHTVYWTGSKCWRQSSTKSSTSWQHLCAYTHYSDTHLTTHGYGKNANQ